MIKIMALDPGTHVGWCVMGDDALFAVGCMDFPLARGESLGSRFLKFRAWMWAMLETNRPDIVVYEQAHMRGGAATDILVGMTTRIQEYCSERGIEYMPVHSMTLKKEMAGTGKASKEQMTTVASIIYPGHDLNEHESDAILLAAYASRKLSLNNA